MKRRHNPSARAFTIVECAISTLLLGGLLAAGLQAAATGVEMRASAAEQARADQLAEDLLTEVTANYVGEPSTGLINGLVSGLLGVDAGENASRKQTFDDIDDYDGWTESPPQYSDGTVMTGYTGWRRSVSVVNVTLADPTVVSASRTGLVRITVTVTTNSKRVFTLSALRSDAIESRYRVPNGSASTDLTFVESSTLP